MGKKDLNGLRERTCFHVMDPVPIGRTTVYASAYVDRLALKDVNPHLTSIPDLGVYLDGSWDRSWRPLVLTTAKVWFPWDEEPQYILVNWPDMGVVPLVLLSRLVNFVLRQPRGRKIEVGCLGGHGRTGTLLSALVMAAEGKSALDAIKEVRRRYCEKAVESSAQLELLRSYGQKLQENKGGKQ